MSSAKAARADFEVIVQTATADCGAATVQGLDGAAHADSGAIQRVWEIAGVSEATAMRDASGDDWLSRAAMLKHARGSSASRPAWTLCEALQEDDAEITMGLAIAMGCSPYETKVPELHGSVGTGYRKRMFEWLERHPQLLLSRGVSTTAVLYSSTSRDALDRARAALYTSTYPADAEWWSDQGEDSVNESQYVADYRGFCKMLFQSHVPFEVVTAPHVTAESLAAYRCVVAPSPAAVSDAVVAALAGWVEAGGTLILTGREAGVMDERAVLRVAPVLVESFGFQAQVEGWADKRVGKGRVMFSGTRVGRGVLRREAAVEVVKAFSAALPREVDTDAPANVLVELRAADGGELVVAFANLDGLGSEGIGRFTPRTASFTCALEVGGRAVSRVSMTNPAGDDQDVPFAMEGTRVRFAVSMRAVSGAIVTFV